MALPNIGEEITVESEVIARPGDFVTFVLLSADGARRLHEGVSARLDNQADVHQVFNQVQQLRWRYPPFVVLYGGGGETLFKDGWYLPYFAVDGTVTVLPAQQETPVNQLPDLFLWKPYVARFAHDLDLGTSLQTALNYSAADREVLWNWGRALIGIVWSTLATWEAIDPNPAVTVDPPAWKLARPGVLSHVEQLCLECEIGSFPRMFLQNADLVAFRNKYAGGQLHGTDRTGTQWVPGMLLDQVSGLPRLTEPQARIKIAQFFEGHKTDFLKALAYWDSTVGHLERPHAHR